MFMQIYLIHFYKVTKFHPAEVTELLSTYWNFSSRFLTEEDGMHGEEQDHKSA